MRLSADRYRQQTAWRDSSRKPPHTRALRSTNRECRRAAGPRSFVWSIGQPLGGGCRVESGSAVDGSECRHYFGGEVVEDLGRGVAVVLPKADTPLPTERTSKRFTNHDRRGTNTDPRPATTRLTGGSVLIFSRQLTTVSSSTVRDSCNAAKLREAAIAPAVSSEKDPDTTSVGVWMGADTTGAVITTPSST